MLVSVNPGPILGSKMVKDAFGVAGGDLGNGADILSNAALTDEFADACGQHFTTMHVDSPHLTLMH